MTRSLPTLIRMIRNSGRNVSDRIVDVVLDINTKALTIKYFRSTKNPDPVHYEAMNYLRLYRLIKPLGLGSSDVVFDVGAGTGRILC